MRLGNVGWLLIAGWIVLAGLRLHPAARAAERFAAANFTLSRPGAAPDGAASAVMSTAT